LSYAKRTVGTFEGFDSDWPERFVLIEAGEYARGSWKTIRGAQKRWDEGFSDGYVEIVPLTDGRFRAFVTFFQLVTHRNDPRPVKQRLEERLRAPLRAPASVRQESRFGLFKALMPPRMPSLEQEDPDRPGLFIPDE
jgi:hypothetical protein